MSVQLSPLLAKAFRNIHQDLFAELNASGADAFDYMSDQALQNIRPSEAPQLAAEIDGLIGGRIGEAELRGLFNRSSASISFRDGAGVLMLLEAMRVKLTKGPFASRRS